MKKEDFIMHHEIDIIIPAYKAKKFLYQSISSISQQTIADSIKVTIVNDSFNTSAPVSLGSSSFRFVGCYLTVAPNVSSDAKLKKDIADIDGAAYITKIWQ